jgi:hypothetical protein
VRLLVVLALIVGVFAGLSSGTPAGAAGQRAATGAPTSADPRKAPEPPEPEAAAAADESAPDVDPATAAAWAVAKADAPASPEEASSWYTTVKGVITDADAGTPLAGECISAELDARAYGAGWYPWASATSGADGSYSILVALHPSLPPVSQFRVRFGCANGDYVPEYWSNTTDPAAATPFPFDASEQTADVGLVSKASVSGRIEGTFTVPGSSADDRCVRFVRTSNLSEVTTQAAADGTYRSPYLVPDDYYVGTCSSSVVPIWYPDVPVAQEPPTVPVTAGSTATGIDFQTTRTNAVLGRISGIVANNPNTAACIEAVDPSSGTVVWTSQVQTGDVRAAYASDYLAPGEYAVRVNDCAGGPNRYYGGATDLATADLVTVTADEITADIDFKLVEYGSITGRIDGTSYGCATAERQVIPQAFSACSGTGDYAVDVVAGDYLVRFDDWTAGGKVWWRTATEAESELITVTDGQVVSGISVDFSTLGRISGTFSSFPDSWSCLQTVDSTTEVVSSDQYVSSSVVENAFRTSYLPPGQYAVRGNDCHGGPYTYYGGASDLATADLVTVTAGETTPDIDISLVGFGRIEGSITGTSYGCATAYLQGTSMTYSACGGSGSSFAMDVVEGDYKLRFDDYSTGWPTQWWDNTTEASADVITVADDETVTGIDVDFTPPPAGRISGLVLPPERSDVHRGGEARRRVGRLDHTGLDEQHPNRLPERSHPDR